MPPLEDDAHWLAIEAAHQQRAVQTNNNDLAVIDLMEALSHDRLPCMARSTATGERKPIAPTEWADQIELMWWKGRVRVFSRKPSVRMIARRATRVREEVRGRVFYVGKQKFDTLWPASGPNKPAAKRPSHQPQRGSAQTAKLPIKAQVAAIFDQVKTEGVSGSDLARDVAQRIGKPKSWQYIRKELPEWGFRQKRPGGSRQRRPKRRKSKQPKGLA